MRIKASRLQISKLHRSSEDRFYIVAEIDPAFLGNARQTVDEFADKTISLDPKKWQEDRSVRSNAYFHELIGKIAEKRHLGFDEVKRMMVCEYGTACRDDTGHTVGAMLPYETDPTAYYPYCKWYDTREVHGKVFNCFMFMKATHELDQAEFNRLIEGVVFEAKELGIETLTPEELRSMGC